MHFLKLMFVQANQWLAYTNIRASLVLILVSTMGFSDSYAFTAYSTMIALGDITGLAGAYLGDKIVGHHLAWIFGALFIFLGYFLTGFFSVENKTEIILALNLIACSVGISRCNSASLTYSAINKEIPKERQNSYISIFYTILVTASFIAYSASGIINKAFGVNGVFSFSGLISLCSISLFVWSECDQIKLIERLWSKLFKLTICLAAILGLGYLTFMYYKAVNTILWITLFSSVFYILYKSHNKKSEYSDEEKGNVIVFIYYMAWLVIYYVFERQFGMVMPLFLTRHFDNNFFGVEIPVTNIMSIFQITIIISSIYFFKTKIHDRINNGKCLFIGFIASLSGFIILYLGCVFHLDYRLYTILVLLPIILFSLSDVFILNRIFSICRVAPKQIHAITTAIMMVGAACGFHGSRIIGELMALNKKQVMDKAYSIEIYKHGFLVDIISLSIIICVLALSYNNKKARGMMERVL